MNKPKQLAGNVPECPPGGGVDRSLLLQESTTKTQRGQTHSTNYRSDDRGDMLLRFLTVEECLTQMLPLGRQSDPLVGHQRLGFLRLHRWDTRRLLLNVPYLRTGPTSRITRLRSADGKFRGQSPASCARSPPPPHAPFHPRPPHSEKTTSVCCLLPRAGAV